MTYKSMDSVSSQDDVVNYPTEFLHGLPPQKNLMNNVIEARILKGKYKGVDVLIPRIPMAPIDMPFDFKRLQFPVRLAFTMIINKSQVQSLRVCGINLENACFSDGQLYVACSRQHYLCTSQKTDIIVMNEITVKQSKQMLFVLIG
uniref:Putative helicase n=1 Tax=Calliphora vicina TaxID=7373 RepID=A0A0K3CSF7_CALVI|nr:putative helicase [Calliphora vicina]